jgi:hypothetical protein
MDNYFAELGKAALLMFISVINMFTCLNVATRKLTPDWGQQ